MTFEGIHPPHRLVAHRRPAADTPDSARGSINHAGARPARDPGERGRSATARHPSEPGHVPGRGDGQGGRRRKRSPNLRRAADEIAAANGVAVHVLVPASLCIALDCAVTRVGDSAWAHRSCPRSAPRQLRWSARESVGCGSRRRSPTAGSWLRMMAPLISTGGRRAVSTRPPGCGRLRSGVPAECVPWQGSFGEGASWEV